MGKNKEISLIDYDKMNELRKELEGKIQEISKDVKDKPSNFTINILMTITILAFAGANSLIGYLFTQTTSIKERLIKMETKFEDMKHK